MENIKLREKIGYGLGDAASSMFWKLFTMYLLFFYTDVVGISSAVVGTMFLITRIWDTFLDPFVGILGDRTNSRWGKFRPYLLWIAIPFGICGILTFSSFGDNMTTKIIFAYATYTLMMMVYSLINVPYASLLGVMSANPQVRTEFSSYRMTFAFGGSILVLFLIEPLVDIFSKMKITENIPDIAFGWQMAAVVFAIMASGMFLLTFLWTKERVQPIKEEKGSLKEDLKDLGSRVETLEKGMRGLNGAVESLSGGMEQLKDSSEELGEASQGIDSLLDGFDKLNGFNDSLRNGADQIKNSSPSIAAGIETMSGGTNRLAAGLDTLGTQMAQGSAGLSGRSGSLRNGAFSLASGTKELTKGGSSLQLGSAQVKGGISRLQSGAGALSAGMAQLEEEGTSRIQKAVKEELQGVLDRLEALSSETCRYDTFSGKDSSMDGTVKFVIETEGIE